MITGGTGFVGRELVKQLRAHNHKITIYSRNELPIRMGITTVTGKLDDAASLDHAMNGVDTVIHLAAVISPKNPAEFQTINVEGTQHILDACTRNKISRFIFMSSYVADPIFETPYGISKHRAEERVRGTTLNWTILRPTLIYGKDTNPLTQLITLVSKYPIVPAIYGILQPISVADVADAVIKTISAPKSFKHTYTLAGDEPISTATLCKRIAHTLGLKRIILRLPPLFSRIMLRPATIVSPGLATSITHLLNARPLSTEGAFHDFGWKPQPFAPQFEAMLKQN